MKQSFFFFACLHAFAVSAQSLPETAVRLADFSTVQEGDALHFQPLPLPLQQKAGGRPAFWTYYWEFGDGNFSREESPRHAYARPGEYSALLYATPHYDDGKIPDKKGKGIVAALGSELAGLRPDAFSEPGQSIALRNNREPAPQEEMVCILSYRQSSGGQTDGQLHLFFNEKSFPARHFAFQEARTHFGEQKADFSAVLPATTAPPGLFDWSSLSDHFSGVGASTGPLYLPPASPAQALLDKAAKTYRDEQIWRFTSLASGERRNLFISLLGTAAMVRDTNTTVHIQAIFEPFDPTVPAQEYTLEMEIVSSHDPNGISVSDNRVNYRFLRQKDPNYKVRFQNNGLGPASTVEVAVEIPNGLNPGKMRPVDWYPKCPICPSSPTRQSCLDTASTRNGLVFTFRNIYLPGSRQADLNDRDSTQGFVKYRIEPEKHMPKRAFRSRARIVFDKNPPIYTNFSATRFKPGLSPGPKMGYAFSADSLTDGYFFLGVSLSPYASWRVYPQVELLTSLKGRTTYGPQIFQDTIIHDMSPDVKFFTVQDSTVRSARGFVGLELPVLLRRNFSRFFGLGLGGSLQVIFDNGERRHAVAQKQYRQILGTPPKLLSETPGTEVVTVFSGTRTQYTVFADLSLGSVRTGPNLGIRVGAALRGSVQPFVQLAFEVKL